MNSVRIKICGLTSPEDAELAVHAGATHVGVIMAGGPRHQSVESARAVLNEVAGVVRVGVFALGDIDSIARDAAAVGVDVIQLHSGATPEAVRHLAAATSLEVWPVVHVGDDGLPGIAEELASACRWLLLDTKSVGQLGGTGVSFNWERAREATQVLRKRHEGLRIAVAGGLHAGNVSEAIHLLHPDLVDVSSGVEYAPGRKDAGKVEAFIRAVTGAPVDGMADAG